MLSAMSDSIAKNRLFFGGLLHRFCSFWSKTGVFFLDATKTMLFRRFFGVRFLPGCKTVGVASRRRKSVICFMQISWLYCCGQKVGGSIITIFNNINFTCDRVHQCTNTSPSKENRQCSRRNLEDFPCLAHLPFGRCKLHDSCNHREPLGRSNIFFLHHFLWLYLFFPWVVALLVVLSWG